MLRGRISRRDISICAFYRHRLFLRPATPRCQPFSNTPNSAADAKFKISRKHPLGPVAEHDWGAPAFVVGQPPNPEPGHSDTPASSPEPSGLSIKIRPPRPDSSRILLSKAELKARGDLLKKQKAIDEPKDRYPGDKYGGVRAKQGLTFERQFALEQSFRNDQKDLRDLADLRRSPYVEEAPLHRNVDLSTGKVFNSSMSKMVQTDTFWSRDPNRTGNMDGRNHAVPNREVSRIQYPSTRSSPSTATWGALGRDTLQQRPQNAEPVRRVGNNTISPGSNNMWPTQNKPQDTRQQSPPNVNTARQFDNNIISPSRNIPRPVPTNTQPTNYGRGETAVQTNTQPTSYGKEETATTPASPPSTKPEDEAGDWGLLARKNKPEITRPDDFWAALVKTREHKNPKPRTSAESNVRNQWSTVGNKSVNPSGTETNNRWSGTPGRLNDQEKWPSEGDKSWPRAPRVSNSRDIWPDMGSKIVGDKTTMKAEDDWGRELDQKIKDRKDIKPQPTSNEETSAEPEPGAKDERPVELQKAQGRDRVQGRRRERFEIGGGSERDSRKRSKRRYHDVEDVGEDGDAADEFESYEERQRRKAERKAQREAERAGPIPILIPELISITALADALKIQPGTFLNQLGELGFEGVTLDSLMVGETAALVAQEYGYEPTVDAGKDRDLKPRPPPKDPSVLPQRPPVVTIMGHVDHGKTTLLDYLRKSSVAAQEHGGITQHIGAFSVKLSSEKPITFLDTPGHAAFLTMRQRGANVTDIVVLVVAADDSVKPQTLEALNHARAAKVPIIVAINKIDKDGAQIDKVKADLATAKVEIEDFGGEVQAVCVSGKTGVGMDELEEAILTLSEILDHRAEVDGPAEGWILESSLKPIGKVATVLVKRGTLRPGDYIAAGLTWAKIRYLRNEAGVMIDEAPPGTPVEILGWKDLPAAGDAVIQAPDEGRAKNAVTYREGIHERERDATAHESITEERKALQEKRARKKSDPEAAEDDKLPEEENGTKIINFVVKGDVHGSVEAVCAAILEIGNHEVQPRVLRSATGPISESDIDHAAISNSTLVNFATSTPGHVRYLAEKKGVKILDHTVIYHLIDDIKATLSKHLAPDIRTEVIGEAVVLEIFPINIYKRVYKNVAGCRVRTGIVERNALYRVLRKKEIIFKGKLETLKHHKKDVNSMNKDSECGMGFEDFQDMEVDDVIQAYKEVITERSL